MTTQLSGFGSIGKDKVQPRFSASGTRLINGRQVGLVIAMGLEANLMGDKLLEFLEFECGITVAALEDIPDGPSLQKIVAKLKERI